ncbi:glutathione S-transferase family protein [Tabrizicola sp.]|uniref:glutathione S-transferase family protein n=1 Tax=Tabrizicola sp. TaxID=2005166 RepID=UPI003F2D2A68
MRTFYFHPSPNPLKVALMLEEVKAPYEVTPIDTFKGEQHQPGFLSRNPNGKLPVLEDDGATIFDSNAILLYLAEQHDAFLPKDRVARASVLSWHFFVATGLSPFSGQAVHFLKMAPEDLPYAKNRYLKEVTRHYTVINDRLGVTKYLGGDTYSIADIGAWGWMNFAGYIFDDGLAGFPNAKRLFDEISARPAAAAVQKLREKHSFKQDFDEEAQRALFPQNVNRAA